LCNGQYKIKFNLAGDTEGLQTLTFTGKYNVKFDYDKKTRKMFNLQFSSNANPTSWNKFQIYDLEDYSDGGYDGKIYTVKDGTDKKFTILYSDSFDYILVTALGSNSAGVTLNLKR
jgi:hypothetical protein